MKMRSSGWNLIQQDQCLYKKRLGHAYKNLQLEDHVKIQGMCVGVCVCVCVRACTCMCMHVCSIRSDSLQPHGLQPARLLCPQNFPGRAAGVGYHFMLQEIFLSQRPSPQLRWRLHQQVDSLPLHQLGSLKKSPKFRKYRNSDNSPDLMELKRSKND